MLGNLVSSTRLLDRSQRTGGVDHGTIVLLDLMCAVALLMWGLHHGTERADQ